MQKDNSSKIEFWQKHLSAAQTHSEGIGVYCKEQGLSITMYYKWKKKLSQKVVLKKTPSFIPVQVSPKVMPPIEGLGVSSLPDARWVAEVLLYLSRGLR